MSDIIELLLEQQAAQTKLADRLAAEIGNGPSLEDYAARERALLDELRDIRTKARELAAREHAAKVARDTAAWLGGQVVAARERREPADAAEALASVGLMRDYPPPSPPPTVLTGGHPVVPDRVVATHGPSTTAPSGPVQSGSEKGKRR